MRYMCESTESEEMLHGNAQTHDDAHMLLPIGVPVVFGCVWEHLLGALSRRSPRRRNN